VLINRSFNLLKALALFVLVLMVIKSVIFFGIILSILLMISIYGIMWSVNKIYETIKEIREKNRW